MNMAGSATSCYITTGALVIIDHPVQNEKGFKIAFEST
jgi:hypothetical protein